MDDSTLNVAAHPGLRHAEQRQTATRERLTIAQYYAYHLMVRNHPDGGENPLPHGAGRLFQQWVVDAYSKTFNSFGLCVGVRTYML